MCIYFSSTFYSQYLKNRCARTLKTLEFWRIQSDITQSIGTPWKQRDRKRRCKSFVLTFSFWKLQKLARIVGHSCCSKIFSRAWTQSGYEQLQQLAQNRSNRSSFARWCGTRNTRCVSKKGVRNVCACVTLAVISRAITFSTKIRSDRSLSELYSDDKRVT